MAIAHNSTTLNKNNAAIEGDVFLRLFDWFLRQSRVESTPEQIILIEVDKLSQRRAL